MFAGTHSKYIFSGRGPGLSLFFSPNRIHLDLAGRGLICHFSGTLPSQIDALLSWLETYLTGQEEPVRPLTLPPLPPFSQKVLTTLTTIPFGKTISYQSLATQLGSPHAARAVGNACHRNPFPLLIPCHRVIQKNNRIGGFALPIEIKKRLLNFELCNC